MVQDRAILTVTTDRKSCVMICRTAPFSLTPNYVKATPLFDAEYPRNCRRYIPHSYNEIIIES